MPDLFHSHSPFRIFGISALLSITVLALVGTNMGWSALLTALVLVIIETAFSFDNAIINAKVLKTLSPFWQGIFLSVGIIIAVFGMRVVFPVVLVMITAGLGWGDVVNLALHHPLEYAHALELAHPAISAFGGGFLLLLALHFFLDSDRDILWHERIEKQMQQLAGPISAPLIGLGVVGVFTILPINDHPMTTFVAGALGISTYMLLHSLTWLIEKYQPGEKSNTAKAVHRTGIAAFTTFIYLEFLDASFSFDGVLGAFAITGDVVLIAAGLGVGALWVRSLTVYMVRKGALDAYKYLDHGAHYTVLVLALVLFVSGFTELPEAVTGLLGLVFITASIIASVRERKRSKLKV